MPKKRNRQRTPAPIPYDPCGRNVVDEEHKPKKKKKLGQTRMEDELLKLTIHQLEHFVITKKNRQGWQLAVRILAQKREQDLHRERKVASRIRPMKTSKTNAAPCLRDAEDDWWRRHGG